MINQHKAINTWPNHLPIIFKSVFAFDCESISVHFFFCARHEVTSSILFTSSRLLKRQLLLNFFLKKYFHWNLSTVKQGLCVGTEGSLLVCSLSCSRTAWCQSWRLVMCCALEQECPNLSYLHDSLAVVGLLYLKMSFRISLLMSTKEKEKWF